MVDLTNQRPFLSVKGRKDEEMRIIKIGYALVEIEDDQLHSSTVFLQDNNRWKCLRHNRLTCACIRFVQQQNPTLPASTPELSAEDMADLIDD